MIKATFIKPEPSFPKGVPIPSFRGPRRERWHILPERHWVKTPIDKTLVGKKVLVRRVIIRTGYLWEHKDVSYWDLYDQVNNLMVYDLQCILGSITDDQEKANYIIINLCNKWGFGIVTKALYEIRDAWLCEMYSLPEYKPFYHLRAFWYVNLGDVSSEAEHVVELQSIKRHMVGVQYPSSSYHFSGPDGDDYDFEPGGLAPGTSQSVYRAEVYMNRYDDFYDGLVSIHPADILAIM